MRRLLGNRRTFTHASSASSTRSSGTRSVRPSYSLSAALQTNSRLSNPLSPRPQPSSSPVSSSYTTISTMPSRPSFRRSILFSSLSPLLFRPRLPHFIRPSRFSPMSLSPFVSDVHRPEIPTLTPYVPSSRRRFRLLKPLQFQIRHPRTGPSQSA